MKLATFRDRSGRCRIGAVMNGGMADLGAANPDFPPTMLDLIRLGSHGLALAEIAAASAPLLAMNDVVLLPPVPNPPAFLGVGLNYSDHVHEADLAMPAEPTVFNKQINSLAGSGAAVLLPRLSDQLDYEGELAVIVGHARRGMNGGEARNAIYGYLIVNDLSLRDIQFASPTVTMGKSFDTHGPCGPWIVTADEISDPQRLRISTKVNGSIRQTSSTANMIFTCSDILVHLSRVMSLAPGTIVTTGTPAGVGHFLDPPGYLRAGDIVEVEIEGLGILTNHVVREDAR